MCGWNRPDTALAPNDARERSLGRPSERYEPPDSPGDFDDEIGRERNPSNTSGLPGHDDESSTLHVLRLHLGPLTLTLERTRCEARALSNG